MKTINFLTILFCLITASAIGQIRDDPEDAYNRFKYAGISTGVTNIFGSLQKSSFASGTIFDYGTNVNSFVSVGFQGEFGTLRSYTPKISWTSGLTSVNNFSSANINIRYSFNNIFKSHDNRDKEVLSRIYWGFGLGIINNDLTTLTDKYFPENKNYISYFKKSSMTGIALENIGLDYRLPRNQIFHNTVFNVNFQANYAFSDYVDGYSFKNSKKAFNDFYILITAGLHFYFGDKDIKW